ncbi:unnamed protein product, partial [Coregonus sp. 'balchen']
GNALRQASAWRGSRGSLLVVVVAALAVVGTLTWLYLASGDPYTTETLVRQAEVIAQPRVYTVDCSEDYENYKRYPGCTPQTCGRAITDNSVTREEAMALRRLAERGLALAGSDGGASILDLHSGALSMGKQFVNIYREVRGRIQAVIAETFDLDPSLLYLTKPTFFSRINSTLAKTQHD